jgi:hypothetical protein
MSMYTFWCLLEGDKAVFKVEIPIGGNIDDLKERIKQKCSLLLDKFAAKDLILWKVRYF